MKNLAFAAAMLVSTSALAATPSIVSHVHSGGGPDNPYDTRPCFFFQTPDTQWYAIPQSNSNFINERDVVIAARLSGNVLSFGVGAGIPECSSIPRAFSIDF